MEAILSLSHKEFLQADHDYARAAEVKYVHELDLQEGSESDEADPALTGEEQVLMKILKGSFQS